MSPNCGQHIVQASEHRAKVKCASLENLTPKFFAEGAFRLVEFPTQQ